MATLRVASRRDATGKPAVAWEILAGRMRAFGGTRPLLSCFGSNYQTRAAAALAGYNQPAADSLEMPVAEARGVKEWIRSLAPPGWHPGMLTIEGED